MQAQKEGVESVDPGFLATFQELNLSLPSCLAAVNHGRSFCFRAAIKQQLQLGTTLQ
jgi:hypothetical protein